MMNDKEVANTLSRARTLIDMINHWDGEDEAERVAVIDAIDDAIRATNPDDDAASRWACPECQSHNVEISLPTWYRETPGYSLTFVNTDSEADPLYWYCNDCCESGTGSPDEVAANPFAEVFEGTT